MAVYEPNRALSLEELIERFGRVREVYDDLNWDRRHTPKEPQNSAIRKEMAAVRVTLAGLNELIVERGGPEQIYDA
jgi:hypothetical protein